MVNLRLFKSPRERALASVHSEYDRCGKVMINIGDEQFYHTALDIVARKVVEDLFILKSSSGKEFEIPESKFFELAVNKYLSPAERKGLEIQNLQIAVAVKKRL